ncbi:MAG: rod shape-determining protein MreC [Elusimicrobiota bacterium]|jgi:rod shape-determining protein MreC|nr:rod shape-determining protein MreC [Elusimicrobiota bacterium]
MIKEKIEKKRKKVFVSLVILSFIFIFFNDTNGVKTIKNIIYYVVFQNMQFVNNRAEILSSFTDNARNLIYVDEMNKFYKKENKVLSDKLRNYYNMVADYNELTKFLKISKIKNTKSVFARVIARDNSGYYRWIIINKGEYDGFCNDLPVVLVKKNGKLCALGRITETYKNSSKVTLITNSSLSVPVEIEGKNVDCLAEGNNSNDLQITYIPISANVEIGDKVVVSGISSVFPKGVYVGVIKSINEDNDMLYFKTGVASSDFTMENFYEVAIFVPDVER